MLAIDIPMISEEKSQVLTDCRHREWLRLLEDRPEALLAPQAECRLGRVCACSVGRR